MEGNKAYRAKIVKLVKQDTKFHLIDRVKVKGTNLMGFVLGELPNLWESDKEKVQFT